MEIIFKRRSVRDFSKRDVSKEQITQLLKAAMQAPSAVNQQPWSFLVVQDEAKLAQLAQLCPGSKRVNEANGVICLMIDTNCNERPHMWAQDMSAAMQNILLQAVHLSLGAYWIGVYPNQERMKNLQTMLNIPARYEPFALCAFGYPKDDNANYFENRFSEDKVFFEEVK